MSDDAVIRESRSSSEDPLSEIVHPLQANAIEPGLPLASLASLVDGEKVASDDSSVRLLPISPSPTSPPVASDNGGRFALFPTAISGTLNAHNEGALDWGWQSCIAFGCQSLVFVVDANSMTRIQVLDQHKHLVSRVKWARENYCHGLRQSYNLRLASADILGNLIVWDVSKGTPQSKFGDSDSPICDMAWHWHQDSTQDMLLVLHPASTFVLWNASTGTIIWRKSYNRSDHLESFDLDPHQPNRVLFIAPDGVWMQDDLTLFKASTGELRKITWQPGSGKSDTSLPRDASLTKEHGQSPNSLRSDVRRRTSFFLNRGSPTTSASADDPNLVAEIFFHRSINDVLVALYSRQIVLVSLRYMCPYRSISIEKSSADILSVLPLRQIEGFFCLHTNGAVSYRQSSSIKTRFEALLQPESSRLMKHCKPYGFVLDPLSETKCSILLNDGRILVWTLHSNNSSPLALPSTVWTRPPPSLILTHSMIPLHAAPLILQARPRSLDPESDHLMAVGSSRGCVQLHNLTTSQIEGEYFIQNAAVQGLKWINEELLLVFAYPHTSSPTALVKSEISVLDIRTGAVRLIRRSATDESPIRAVKISPTKDHFVIIFKNGVPEVWSIFDGRRLVWHRPKAVPQATAAEWVRVTESWGAAGGVATTRQDLILFVDLNGLFQAFKVKGNIVHEDKTSVFATQTTIGHITAMCRKRNKIVMGDVDGSLIKWLPSDSMAETKNLNRGWIKSIKFSPKERTMWAAVLFNDGLDVWEIETMELINQLKPKQYKVTSLDWVSATHLALCCTDGIIRIFDFRNFQNCSSGINQDILIEHVANPYVLRTEVLLKAKSSLLLGQDSGALTSKALRNPIVDFSRLPALPQMSTIDRCFAAALLLGDESDNHFWKACMRALPCTGSVLKNIVSHSDWSFFLKKDALKELHSEIANSVLSIATANPGRIDCARRCVQDLVAFGAFHQAVEYLLNLDSQEQHYYEDCLKAALLTALDGNTSEAVHSTIKLVATNLIASSFMTAGIELLCAIGKMGDACRYLQSGGNYAEAANLASLRLPLEQARDVYMKWIDHLCLPEINQRSLALLLCLHCGSLDRALELMATSRNFERAAMFLRICEEEGILEDIVGRNPVICEAIYLEYARYLHGIGLRKEALDFCDKGGKNGRLLRQEFEILNRDFS